MHEEKRVKKSSVFVVMLMTLGSRILGLYREMIKAQYLGNGGLTDAFNVAFTIPNLLRRLFAESSMTVAFIPTFKGYLKDGNREETREFINSIFTVLTFLVSTTVIIGMITTPMITPLLNKRGADVQEIILLTRIMYPYLAFISLAALLQGILNGLNIFAPGSFVPILFNISTITFTIILTKLQLVQNPARAMAIGVTVGGVLQMFFQLPYIIKNRYSFRFQSLRKSFRNRGTRKVGRLIAPTLASMGAYQLSIAVAQFVSINTGESVSAVLGYSLRLQELVLGIFAVSIGTVLISTLSRDAKHKDWENFSSSLRVSLNGIALLTIPVSVYAYVHAQELVELIYFKGEFKWDGVLYTASVFRIHIAGLYFIALTRVLAPAFFSLEDSKTPAKLGIISVLIGIPLMFILAPILKAEGIAIATVTSSVILLVLYFIFLSKRSEINFAEILRSVLISSIKMTILSILSITPVILLKERIFSLITVDNRVFRLGIPLFITTVIFFTVYIVTLFTIREKSVIELKRLAKKR